MKTTLLTISSCLAITGFTFAECKDGSCSTDKAPSCKDGACEAGTCKDDESCVKEEGATFFAVTGMTCKDCSDKLDKALSAVDGVAVKQVCFKSGNVIVKIDEAKATKAQAVKAITDAGFKVEGESVNLNVKGMTCSACSDKLTKALSAVDGVIVKKVCHESGCVNVVVDGDKADAAKVKEAVLSTGFKVE